MWRLWGDAREVHDATSVPLPSLFQVRPGTLLLLQHLGSSPVQAAAEVGVGCQTDSTAGQGDRVSTGGREPGAVTRGRSKRSISNGGPGPAATAAPDRKRLERGVGPDSPADLSAHLGRTSPAAAAPGPWAPSGPPCWSEGVWPGRFSLGCCGTRERGAQRWKRMLPLGRLRRLEAVTRVGRPH